MLACVMVLTVILLLGMAGIAFGTKRCHTGKNR